MMDDAAGKAHREVRMHLTVIYLVFYFFEKANAVQPGSQELSEYLDLAFMIGSCTVGISQCLTQNAELT